MADDIESKLLATTEDPHDPLSRVFAEYINPDGKEAAEYISRLKAENKKLKDTLLTAEHALYWGVQNIGPYPGAKNFRRAYTAVRTLREKIG